MVQVSVKCLPPKTRVDKTSFDKAKFLELTQVKKMDFLKK